jgi:large subunit ribosomal protein L35
MPKIKTKRAAAKRLKKTKNGKVARHKAYSSHLKAAKTSKRRRNLRKGATVSDADLKAALEMLPYSY